MYFVAPNQLQQQLNKKYLDTPRTSSAVYDEFQTNPPILFEHARIARPFIMDEMFYHARDWRSDPFFKDGREVEFCIVETGVFVDAEQFTHQQLIKAALSEKNLECKICWITHVPPQKTMVYAVRVGESKVVYKGFSSVYAIQSFSRLVNDQPTSQTPDPVCSLNGATAIVVCVNCANALCLSQQQLKTLSTKPSWYKIILRRPRRKPGESLRKGFHVVPEETL